jgi:hypothetical protein
MFPSGLQRLKTSSGGGIHLVYAGISEKHPGIQVFSRDFRKGCWQAEQAHPAGKTASVKRSKLAVNGKGEVWMAADVYENRQFRAVYSPDCLQK